MRSPLKKYELFTLVLIVFLGACLRFYRLNDVPPGLFRDEALIGLFATQLLDGPPVLFFGQTGETEPVFVYWLAWFVATVGHSAYSLRIAAAMLGVLTLAGAYLFAKRWAQGDRRVALLATTGLATSYWHVQQSRTVFRALSLPLLEALALWGLLWASDTLTHYLETTTERPPLTMVLTRCALSGLLIGLCLYTYLAARVLPLVFVLFWAWWLITHMRRRSVLPWRPVALAIGSASLLLLLITLPILVKTVQSTSSSPGRVSETFVLTADEEQDQSGAASNQAALPAGMLVVTQLQRGLGLFFVQGDLNQRHNLSGRPVFDPLNALLFLSGLVLLVFRLRVPSPAGVRSFLVLTTLLVMLLPTLLSVDAPHFLRANGLLPVLYLFPATALVTFYDRYAQIGRMRLQQAGWISLAGAVFALVWAIGMLAITVHDYFGTFAHQRLTAEVFEADVRDVAEYLTRHPELKDEAAYTYLGTSNNAHPVFAFLLDQPVTGHWLESAHGLVLPAEVGVLIGTQQVQASRSIPHPVRYVLGNPAPQALPTLRHIWPDAQTEAQWLNPDGTLRTIVIVVPAGTVPHAIQLEHPSALTLGGGIQLLGTTLPVRTTSPGVLPVTLLWRITQRLPDLRQQNLRLFVHLLDTDQQAPGALKTVQWNEIVLPPAQWRDGDVVLAWADLPIPARLPTGRYLIDTGLFTLPSLTRLPVTDATGGTIGTDAVVADIKLEGVSPPIPATLHPVAVNFGPALGLRGYLVNNDYPHPGSTVQLTLLWQALTRVGVDYTVFVHIVDAHGTLVAQFDGQPQQGHNPTSFWEAGEQIVDRYSVPLPETLPAGTYRILVGWYDPATGDRVPLDQLPGDAFPVTTIVLQ